MSLRTIKWTVLKGIFPELIFFRKTYMVNTILLCTALCTNTINIVAQKGSKLLPPLSLDKGKLIYIPDSIGNRIPDFSFVVIKHLNRQFPM